MCDSIANTHTHTHGNVINDPLLFVIANCLNDHFSTVGTLMANEIASQTANVVTKDPLSYIDKDVETSLFMNFSSSLEIFDQISKLKNKKSSGYDLISNSILKSTKFSISPYL